MFFSENREPEFSDDSDREEWEAEQKRLDREWYGLDEGYDETNNPFASTSEEYTRKKEAQLAKLKGKKKMSAQQRQINKVQNFVTFCLDAFQNHVQCRSVRSCSRLFPLLCCHVLGHF